MPPPGDDLETVQHPTLGALKFPKDMSQEDRTKAIDYAIKQKYGLGEDVDLRQQYTHTPANLGSDIEKFGKAYQEAHAGEKPTIGERVKRALGLEEGAGFGGEGWGGGMAPRTVGETLAPAFYGATEALGAAVGPPLGRAARAAWKVLGPSESRVAGERVAAAGEAAGERAAGKVLPTIGGQVERVMPPETLPPAKAPIPSADVQLNAIAQRIFKKPYSALTSEEQVVVARNTGGAPPAERRTTVGTAPGPLERRAGAMPLPTKAPGPVAERRVAAGAAPGGVERRSQAMKDWEEAQARSAATGQPTPGETLGPQIQAARAGAPPGITEGEAWAEIMRNPEEWARFSAAPSKQRDQMLVAAKNRLVEARGPQPGTLPPTPAAIAPPAPPGAAPGPPGATMPTTPRARATLPAAPASTILPSTREPSPGAGPMSLDEILRRATGQPGPTPLQPNVPLSEQLKKA